MAMQSQSPKGTYDHNTYVPAPAGGKNGGSSKQPTDAPKLYHDNGKKITNPDPKAPKWGGNRIKVDGKRVKNNIGRPGWDKAHGADSTKAWKAEAAEDRGEERGKVIKRRAQGHSTGYEGKGRKGERVCQRASIHRRICGKCYYLMNFICSEHADHWDHRAGSHAGGSHKYNVVTATLPDKPDNPDAGTRAHHLGVKYDKNRVVSWDGTDSVMPPKEEPPNANKKKTKAVDLEGKSFKRRAIRVNSIWEHE
ncbi:hypothetical protein MMC11_008635 [Xylographa trunciseda]|nr:hypothetical protein [Xylographa trunciseda]